MENNSVNPLPAANAAAPPDELDHLIAGTLPVTVKEPKALTGTNDFTVSEPSEMQLAILRAAEEMEDIKVVIQQMQTAELTSKGKKIYPKALLRQQHIIAYMLLNPYATGVEVCRFFSISRSTLSNITKSDTFKAAAGKYAVSLENYFPELREQLNETLKASLEVVQKAVIDSQDPDYALSVMDKTANRLGFGAKPSGPNVQINNNVVTAEMLLAARNKQLGMKVVNGDGAQP